MEFNGSSKKTGYANIVCAVLMLIAVVLLFTPYWHYDGQTASINAYVWFPTDQKPLEAYLEGEMGAAPNINEVITAPILLLLLGVIGIVLCAVKRELPFTSMMSIAFGAVGLCGYLSCNVFRYGTNYTLHIILFILALIAGVCGCMCLFKQILEKHRGE